MPNYLVERSVPGAGELSSPELLSIAQQCTLALDALEAQILWVYSLITADRMVGLYIAADETAVREHARCSGLPIQRISEVLAVIGPTMEAPGPAPNGTDVVIDALIMLPADSDNPLY